MNEAIIQITDFRKSYGDLVAVDDISFQVHRGEIFGLLGPNGAGKTTTLECLEGLRQSDGGKMTVSGVDPSREPGKLSKLIGVQLQTSSLPDDMTVNESMRFFCAYQHVAPRYDLLDRLGLAEKRKSRYSELSTGQKRRLALALAVAHEPPVLILDEPTAGLDVASRTELHRMMQELKENNTAILLATHDMAEAEKVTDRVAILLGGKLAAEGTPTELTAAGSGLTKVSVRSEHSLLQQNNTAFPAVRQKTVKEDYAIYFSTDPGPTVAAILGHLATKQDALIDLRVERPSLEERFLEITNTGGQK